MRPNYTSKGSTELQIPAYQKKRQSGISKKKFSINGSRNRLSRMSTFSLYSMN